MTPTTGSRRVAAFLRGINVGGIRVPMAELRVCFEALGLSQVSTLLQTGNVLFTSDRPLEELKPLLELTLSERFHYEAYVLLVEASGLASLVDEYPFPRDEDHHAYVIFVGETTVLNELADQGRGLGEPLQAGTGVLYWRVPKGQTLDTPFSKVLGRARYKATSTNRNVNTLERMLKDELSP